MMHQTWIILGASSGLARAFARKAAAEGCSLLLAGRDLADISITAEDCALRGAPSAEAIAFDCRKPGGFDAILETARNLDGAINIAVFASSMPDQAEIDADPSLLDGVIQDGFTGPARFLHMAAPLLEERGCGTIVGVGSVAGDRGRLKNFVYGSAKGGLATYLSGLRNRLGRSGVHVLTVKPGFMDTGMSWGVEGMFLVAAPADAAEAIWKAAEKRRNEIYVPFFWRYIMLVIRNIPEAIFKKMSI